MKNIHLTDRFLPEDFVPPRTIFRKVHNDVRVDDWYSIRGLESNRLSDLRKYLILLYGEAPELKYRTFSRRILEDKFGYQYWGSWGIDMALSIPEELPKLVIVVDSIL